jgi:hypothetical protein
VPPFPFLQPDADIRIPDAGSSEEISPAQGRTKAVRAGERIDLSLYHAILSEHILPPTSGDDIRVRLFELRASPARRVVRAPRRIVTRSLSAKPPGPALDASPQPHNPVTQSRRPARPRPLGHYSRVFIQSRRSDARPRARAVAPWFTRQDFARARGNLPTIRKRAARSTLAGK